MMNAQKAAEKAVAAIGCGYDLTHDYRLPNSSGPSTTLIELDHSLNRDLVLPGGIVVPAVSASIKCDKGERTRFCSDVLTFNQMSELFNHEMSLSGKIPCGHFNRMFHLKGSWQKDAAVTKALALDGWWISLYTVELAKSQFKLKDHVKRQVPSSWDPAALAQFIGNFGTHVIVGVKMGGKDVIHMKQLHTSNLQPTELQKLLKKLADESFSQEAEHSFTQHAAASSAGKHKDKRGSDLERQLAFASSFRPSVVSHSKNDDVLSVRVKRGGVDLGHCHKQWLSTLSESPTVITMSFVPITSLLNGVQGCGFLSHAVNLYLRYNPPIEELAEFLEFQLPRQWAPQFNDLPLGLHRKRGMSPKLQFSFMGPKLSINTEQVDTENRPVTGMRLFLEGKKCNHLAIHLQHLSAIPKILHFTDDADHHNSGKRSIDVTSEKEYFEPVKMSIFSHVCTAPIEHHGTSMENTISIVTRARLEVRHVGMKKVLFLRLGFSAVACSKNRRSEWDGPSTSSKKSGMFSNLISGRFSSNLTPQPEEPKKPDINSALYPGGPPVPVKAPKLAAIVDMKEMVRGPEDHPGYWVVTGAKLCVENGKVSLKAKYSLLTMLSEEDSMLIDD